MEFEKGIKALRLMSRTRGASVYEIADDLEISVRHARDIVRDISCDFCVYDGPDNFYPRRIRYYLSRDDEFGNRLGLW